MKKEILEGGNPTLISRNVKLGITTEFYLLIN